MHGQQNKGNEIITCT